jgi:hypothetical protein
VTLDEFETTVKGPSGDTSSLYDAEEVCGTSQKQDEVLKRDEESKTKPAGKELSQADKLKVLLDCCMG